MSAFRPDYNSVVQVICFKMTGPVTQWLVHQNKIKHLLRALGGGGGGGGTSLKKNVTKCDIGGQK